MGCRRFQWLGYPIPKFEKAGSACAPHFGPPFLISPGAVYCQPCARRFAQRIWSFRPPDCAWHSGGQWQLSTGRQNAKRNREVEMTRFFGQIGGRKVDSNTAQREFKMAVLKCGAHALPAFSNFGIG